MQQISGMINLKFGIHRPNRVCKVLKHWGGGGSAEDATNPYFREHLPKEYSCAPSEISASSGKLSTPV